MPRKQVVKPHNSGQWTAARFASFVKSALRRAQWPVKYQCLRDAYVEDGINEKTKRRVKLYRCNICEQLYMQKNMKVDHASPVVDPHVGFVDWNTYIVRLFCEIDNLQAVCNECHNKKSAEERLVRNAKRKTS